jgi:hypothetical protein
MAIIIRGRRPGWRPFPGHGSRLVLKLQSVGVRSLVRPLPWPQRSGSSSILTPACRTTSSLGIGFALERGFQLAPDQLCCRPHRHAKYDSFGVRWCGTMAKLRLRATAEAHPSEQLVKFCRARG